MRLIFLTSFLIFFSTNLIAQITGEEITYDSTKGVNYVKYWSVVDSTFYTVPLFPGDKHNPVIEARVIPDEEKGFFYKYLISNSEKSVRELYSFSIYIEPQVDINGIKSPNEEWRNRYVKWMDTIKWTQTNSRSDTIGTQPGKSVPGEFTFESNNIPGIVTAKTSSYWGLGNTLDEGPVGEIRIKVDSLLESTKYIKINTLAPRYISIDISNTTLLDTLQSYLSFSCDTTWIENQGICRSLEAKLDNVERQLERDNTRPAAGSLQAFLNELNALKEEEQISSEAYALLFYNGEFLLDKLEE